MSKPTKLTIILARALSKSLGVFDECGELGVIERGVTANTVPNAVSNPGELIVTEAVDRLSSDVDCAVVRGTVGTYR